MSKRKKEVPSPVDHSPKDHLANLHVWRSTASFDPNYFHYDDSFKPGNPYDFRSVHTIPEMMECLDKNPEIEYEGIIIEANSKGQYRYRKIHNKAELKEVWKRGSKQKKLREADTFASDTVSNASGANTGLVGDDYVPLMGGPFNKQPYLYDYLRAHAYCFYEYQHHPMARAVVNITRDFVLGRGYRIDCKDQRALALWKAFEKVNKFDELMEHIVTDGSWSGETLLWWLPGNATYISYQVAPGQEPSRGLIPRIRMMDPSTCWEIVTYPEDITRVISYNFVFPTQYQIYTGKDKGSTVPSMKFIHQQIPAADMMHFKYNATFNEKRGRSDLFPILGYLKWVRDCTQYELIALKKQTAWTEDITVEGSQADVDNLASALKALGEFEPAGSRFIHTGKIKRELLATQIGNHQNMTIMSGIDMIAAGSQIPVTYFGLSHSAGQTRASALVGTEPVAKKMERKQLQVKRIIEAVWRRFQDTYGIKGSECEITLPEIISQDSADKIKNIIMTKDEGFISKRRASNMAVKELNIDDDYDYDDEQKEIETEAPEDKPVPTVINPLTAVGQEPTGSPSPQTDAPSAVTKSERHHLDQGNGA